tara:strand:+ start:34 stop:156 length:123 start_codon:yes stop_codon:yes gene_type:complete
MDKNVLWWLVVMGMIWIVLILIDSIKILWKEFKNRGKKDE